MSEMIFTKEGIILRKKVSLPLGREKYVEDKISYEELANLGNIGLLVNSIVPIIENGILKAIKLQISHYELYEKSREIENKSIISENKPRYIKEYYSRMHKPGTLPYIIRETIRRKGKITDKELREELKKLGYSPTAGGIGATIKVLRDSGEIKVEGRGKNKVYIYIKWEG